MRRLIRSLLPFDRKYSPEQRRDDHGRFSSGGGAGGGSSSGGAARPHGIVGAVRDAIANGSTTAAKVLAAVIVISGGLAHFAAYARRLQRISKSRTLHQAINLALTPVRRTKAMPDTNGNDPIDYLLGHLLDSSSTFGEYDSQQLLDEVLPMIPAADAAALRERLRTQGLIK
jgi:hypothetical protein